MALRELAAHAGAYATDGERLAYVVSERTVRGRRELLIEDAMDPVGDPSLEWVSAAAWVPTKDWKRRGP